MKMSLQDQIIHEIGEYLKERSETVQTPKTYTEVRSQYDLQSDIRNIISNFGKLSKEEYLELMLGVMKEIRQIQDRLTELLEGHVHIK